MEFTYISLLLSSIIIGFPIREIGSRRKKQLISSGFGVGAVVLVCGLEIIYPFLAILMTYCIVRSRAGYTEVFSFVFAFLFLLLYRNANIFGLPHSTDIGSGVVMMMTLKLAGLVIDIQFFRESFNQVKENRNSNYKFQLPVGDEPTFDEIFCFSFCYIGLFTGPLFRLRTYRDFLNQSPEEARSIPWKHEVKERLKTSAFCFSMFILTSYFFSLSFMTTDEFYTHGILYRLLYSVPILIMTKSRFYCGWMLSECMCVTAAFGAYLECTKPRPGHGPTVDIENWRGEKADSPQFSFEAIRCMDPSQAEWCATIRDLARNWNTTVHWWLVHYVYKRIPPHLGTIRDVAVFLWSAFWHGFHPGYYVSFLTVILFMAAEDVLLRKVKSRLPQTYHKYYDRINCFFKWRVIEYSLMPFLFLTWQEAYRWWKSFYFFGHFIALFIILGGVLSKFGKSQRQHNT